MNMQDKIFSLKNPRNTEKEVSEILIRNPRSRFYKSARNAGAIVISLLMLSGPAIMAAPTEDSTGNSSSPTNSSMGFFEYTSSAENVMSYVMNTSGEQLVLSTVSNAISSNATGTLGSGVSSEEVKDLQQRLMDLDYMDPDEPTDYYGPQTKFAVQLFQRQHDLQVDGIAGPTTIDLLNSDAAKPYTLSLNADGTDVTALQERLAELGYFKVAISGHFGPETENAVKAFQKQNGLGADGKVGSVTHETVFDPAAKAAPAPIQTATPTPTTPIATASASAKATTSTSSKTATAKPRATSKSTTKSSKTAAKPSKTSSGGSSTTRVPDASRADKLVAFAQAQLGKPYVRAAKGPNAFDCSGFVYYALNNSGIGISQGYMTSGGWAGSSYARVNSISELRRGDIVCFRGHVGIYLGNGSMIDASSSQGKIRISSNLGSSPYWTRNFICGRRVL